MKQKAGDLLSWWLPLIILSLLAYFIQMHLYLHKDVAYLLHEAGLMLQGETYANTIFEPNPPLILFLSMPPFLLSKIASIDLLSAMRLYVILLAMMSAALSYVLIRKIFHEKFLVRFVAYTVAATLLFLPAHQFGQREHLLMIFILPYLFAAGLRLENKKIPLAFALVIGIMAAIGFSIKPHFLFSLILIELYFCVTKHSLFGWVRIESLCIAAWMMLYIGLILIVYPTYLKVVYPLWWPYYKMLVHPLRSVLVYPSLLYALSTIIFYYLMRRTNHYRMISQVFLLALIGFIFSFLLPRVNWYYHILPALSASSILLAIALGQFVKNIFQSKHANYEIVFSLIISLFFAVPFIQSSLFLVDSILFYDSQNTWSRLIDFLNKASPNNSFDYFSNTHSLIILEEYAHAHYVGRFPSLWWLYDYAFLKYKPIHVAKAYYDNQFPWFANAVAADLKTQKPQFIIIDLDSESEKYYGQKIDYLKELFLSPGFKKAWRSYQPIKTIDQYEIYQRKS